MNKESSAVAKKSGQFNERINSLIAEMTLREKIGQMSQIAGQGGVTDQLKKAIRNGEVGSLLNETDLDTLNEIQRIAVEESRLGIPIIIGRDVIHGFQTMLPIPIGQASSWNPEIIEKGARISAIEAASVGIHWTFAPMIDITRDPRWGRIAESLGEDPYLTSVLGAAMVKGFQGDDLSNHDSIAACAKHFAAYGYSESGKDYAYVNISENDLRNTILPPFKAAKEAGVATFMTAFSDVNGVPATANQLLMKKILRQEWGFEGFVVSDWDSVIQLTTQGYSKNHEEAAFDSVSAGVDMEMASRSYIYHLEDLVDQGRITIAQIDECVRNILKIKFDLGLFDDPFTNETAFPEKGNQKHLEIAKQAAIESCVLLKNDFNVLPLNPEKVQNLAIIGPLANDALEQMGTWTFDGVESWCETPLQSIQKAVGEHTTIRVARGLETTRTKNRDGFAEAIEAAKLSETVILFMGEEAILSGEAHCRADIDLPGYQNELLEEISKLGKTTILVIMAGRPLTLTQTQHYVNSMIMAWHPGTMGGPAISDILFGKVSPSGKLPFSFPTMVGQIPIYYNQRKSGRPAKQNSFLHIDDIPARAPQTSTGNTSFHMDAGVDPLYPFGHGLSYTHFSYGGLRLSKNEMRLNESIEILIDVSNVGDMEAVEIVQMYTRDRFGSVTRPVRELKGFQRISLKAGETKTGRFEMHTDQLSFYNKEMKCVTEPGDFDLWIGGDSNATHHAHFKIIS
ncbi:beta-glucosidase BglX [Cryomorpha ignava]|uniref:beta-glucosidase n=1 Tax=Cryomorpha ignava TaxID=101383 RepID=A0A7K3WM31_9FLAO|nr:beta-glucosidase BglX [Cryomorpha ignava]NEN22707.1 beta-glucosidase BglX [Cryomorpha ignava]